MATSDGGMATATELKYFPKLVLYLIHRVNAPKPVENLYLKYMSLWNYIVVGFSGYLINTTVLYSLVNMIPLWLANAIAVIIAFLCNWTFSVGPLGYLMGLSKREEKK